MKKSLVIYYVVLLGVLSTWNYPELPPIVLRLAFLVLVVGPVMFSNNKFFPCVLSAFVMISANRHVPSYMPFLPMYLAITTLLAFAAKRFKRGLKVPGLLLALVLITFLVDIGRSMSVESVSITALMIALFFTFIDTDVQGCSQGISLSFVIVSAFLCIETFVFRNEFTYTMSVGNADFERVGWSDPNYFSGIIGMGAIAALNLLLSPERENKRIRYLLLGVIILVISVSLMIASRGAIVAVFLSGAVLLILSSKRSRTSMGLLLFLVAFIAVLYQTGAFDFLMSRFTNDEGELGGRRIIWMSKLTDFSAQASPLDWLIGLGHKGGLAMSSYVGNRDYVGFHNDYIAMLVSYGLIGLLLIVALYLYPMLKYKDPRVTAGCFYMMLISMSLEPLYSGALDIFYFYFYVCVLGESARKRGMTKELKNYITNKQPFSHV